MAYRDEELARAQARVVDLEMAIVERDARIVGLEAELHYVRGPSRWERTQEWWSLNWEGVLALGGILVLSAGGISFVGHMVRCFAETWGF